MKIEKNRKQNRLRNYDYSQNGIYFVTICVKDREYLFGKIENGEMILNDTGKIAEQNLIDIPNCFKNVFLDHYAIMPNHIHAIFEIINDVGTDLASVQNPKPDNETGQTQGLSLQKINFGLISRIVQVFKSKTAVEYIKLMKSKKFLCITKIWQRSFHDRIIRNEIELNKIREYIINNPQNWETDRNNPINIK